MENGNCSVGTQTIEVSLDIDYDICFTEPAPIDALIQRFGRVNRRKNADKDPRRKGSARSLCSRKGSENDHFIYNEQKVAKTLDSCRSLISLTKTCCRRSPTKSMTTVLDRRRSNSKRPSIFFRHLIEEQAACTAVRTGASLTFTGSFSAIEAVPLCYAAAYDECMQSGKIYDAMKYVVPLTLGQDHKLKSEKPGQRE